MAWLSWRNLASGAAVDATRVLPSLPPERLLNPVVSERYRAADLSPGDTRTRVTFDFGTAVQIGLSVWIRPRRSAAEEQARPPSFVATDTMRHLLSLSNGHDGEVYDSGDQPSGVANGVGVHARIFPASAPVRYAAAEFDAPSRALYPENFVDWGYAHYGAIDFEPQIDIAAPAVFQWQEGAERRFAWDNSTMRVRRKARRRRWRLTFRAIRVESERAAMEDFLEFAGDGGRFIVGLNRVDMSRGVMLAALDVAAWTHTSRKLGQLDLPILEAF